jgi:hypothetical protein
MAKLVAYCLKTKTKEEMNNAVIKKTKKGGYQAQGVSNDGLKLSLMLTEEKALTAVKDGVATKEGW